MKKIKLYEAFIGEAFEVHYSDGIRGMQKFGDKNKAISYMKDKIATNKNLKDIAVYNAGSGFHSTADVDAVISWWGDGSYLDNVSKKDNKLAAKKLDESLVTEGQFSWMTHDTGNQIGSEKENTIAVTMFDDKGNKWLERKYDGYGEFGGKDYYELLAQMNGVENADRQDGIDIAFGKMKIKGDVLFPALIEEPNRFNFKRHDFTQEPENDPNQSWYQEPEYDDDDEQYDDYDESKVTEAKALPLDKLTKMIGDKPSCYSLADFVYTNYDKVTGLKKSMRNDEMDFPSEIMDLVDHYGFDVDDFTDKYSMAAESLNVNEAEKIEVGVFVRYKKDKDFTGGKIKSIDGANAEIHNWDGSTTELPLKDLEYVKSWNESLNVDEKEVNLFDEVGPELEALRSKISGLMKKSEDDKWTSALGKALSALSTLDRNLSQADSKLGVVPVNESAMSDIDILAQESKDFKTFVKAFKKEYSNLDAGSPKELEAWLQTIYDNAKESMDESIVNEAKDVKSEAISRLADFFGVSPSSLQKFKFDGKDPIKDLTNALNATSYEGAEAYYKVAIEMAKRDLGIDESLIAEGKHWHVLSGNTWYTGSDFSTNPADAMKYDDIMSATKVAKKVGGMVHVMTDEEMTKAIKKFGKNESKVTEAVAPAGLTKAETKKVAETYAKAISKHDGVKCTVNAKSLEEDSFDLDIDGEEYAGGSYMITLDGDVINAALPEKPVYGQIDSTVDQIIKNLKK